MTIKTCSVSFKFIVFRYFSKWRLKMSKKLKRLQPPPSSDFDGLPYPRVRWSQHFFFHQNDRKGCNRDYLYALDHFLLRFGATEKNRKRPPWLDEGQPCCLQFLIILNFYLRIACINLIVLNGRRITYNNHNNMYVVFVSLR